MSPPSFTIRTAESTSRTATSTAMATTTIYVLQLKEGKYYVGSSDNVERRFQEHCSGEGSAWTRRYEPMQVLQKIVDMTRFHEDAIVETYMAKYGINNVRGGTYSQIQLPKEQRKLAKLKLRHAGNECMACGATDHFVSTCPLSFSLTSTGVSTNSMGRAISTRGDQNERHGSPARQRCRYQCLRCGRDGHVADDCFATRHENGRPLWLVDDDHNASSESDDDYDINHYEFCCTRCGRKGHDVGNCFEATEVRGKRLEGPSSTRSHNARERLDSDTDDEELCCTRCGRNSHDVANCFAATDVHGRCLEVQSYSRINNARERPDSDTDDGELLCTRCGRNTHDVTNCFAASDVRGSRLEVPLSTRINNPRKRPDSDSDDDGLFCTRCGRNTHIVADCFASTDVRGSRLERPSSTRSNNARGRPYLQRQGSSWYRSSCRRCGRANHREDQCFAARHVGGSTLDSSLSDSDDSY